MEDVFQAMGSLSPGVVVAILSAVLLLIMLLIYSADASARDRKKFAITSEGGSAESGLAQAYPASEQPSLHQPIEPAAAITATPAVPEELDTVWAEAIKSMQSLQQQLTTEISSVAAVEPEPYRRELPAALLAIYKSLQVIGQGSWSAQQAARAAASGHGITQIQVSASSLKTLDGIELQFLLDDRYFLLSGMSRKGAQSGLLELNLYYEEPDPIATIRYRLPDHGNPALIQLRQGAWMGSILACAQRVSSSDHRSPTSS